ncbi:hypothetical protein H4696_003706 [Amycolatopsis lexingtonensis]|uniref:Uncharacterized protein n=1 Tax=Amycolatopsis lexingtonensis TaxID=218822 RepID=A0ABR9I074_9PSEU|nr:hypothetical protein [Amycolatopsis lexingtonensis]MBE1496606.1 hypothetical protein [Amycolatopsis lexingtonensis]
MVRLVVGVPTWHDVLTDAPDVADEPRSWTSAGSTSRNCWRR